MINLYESNCEDFDNNGIGILKDAIKCEVSEALNGELVLNMEYPMTSKYIDYIVNENIVKCDAGLEEEQLFRIKHVKPNINTIEVYAEHISYDLADNFLEDVFPQSSNGASSLNWILSHTLYKHKFTSFSDIVKTASARYVRKNPIEAIIGDLDNSFVNLWGGELKRNNFVISMLTRRGSNRGYKIKYRKNLTGLDFTIDNSNIVTKIMPQGYNGLFLPEKYVDSPLIANYVHPKVKLIEFSDVKVKEDAEDEDGYDTPEEAYAELRRLSNLKYSEDNIDKPIVNLKVDFIDLSKTTEYKNYTFLESVAMGDTVTIELDYTQVELRVIKTTYDALSHRYTKLELGEFRANYITDSQKDITNIVKKEGANIETNILAQAKQDATDQLINALGGNVYKTRNELFIMDTDNPETAQKIWRWNLNGLGYSKNGINGPYELAATQDGKIVADFIATGEMAVARIKGLVDKLKGYDDTIAELTIGPDSIVSRVAVAEGNIQDLQEQSIADVDVEYALGTSSTVAPTTGWSTQAPTWENGKYMWQRTVTTYADNTIQTSSATCISGAKGDKGDKGNPGENGTNGTDGEDGANGVGVKELVEQYYLSTSSTSQTGGSWQTTQPTWVSGTYIWTRSKVTWTNDTITYTTPVLASSINKANETAKTANDTASDTKNNFGTYIEQNYAHVKVAWNQISEFIQMMIINNNASFAILDENKKILTYLDKTGEHFCNSSGNVFGEMGVQNVDNNNYIAFSVESDYDTDTQDGMAWGIKTKKDNKFHPILFIRNFNIGPENSDASFGELELNSCDLVLNGLGTGIKTGGVLIQGDPTGLALSFLAQEAGTNLLTICPPSFLGEASMQILDNIQFFKNQAGSNSLKLGSSSRKYSLLTDDGSIQGNWLYINGEAWAKSYNNVSTAEEKKDIKKYNKSALEEVLNTEIYNYRYKSDEDTEKIRIGAIIGDGYKTSNEIIASNGKGIDTYSMISIAFKAVQEQQEQILELQKKDKQKDEIITELIARIEKLEGGNV